MAVNLAGYVEKFRGLGAETPVLFKSLDVLIFPKCLSLSLDFQESERPAAVEEVCLAMGSAFRELHSVFLEIDKLGRLPKPLATEQSSMPLPRKGGSLKSILPCP